MDPVGTVTLPAGPLADVAGASCAALVADLERLALDPPRAVLVVAPGGAGGDDPRVATPAGLRDPAAILAAIAAPTVVAWNGALTGPAAELALAADLRVAGTEATMAFPEVGRGELPCWGGTQRLTRAGGVALALSMLVAGMPADAPALARSGLAHVVADPIEHGRALAASLASGAPRAQAAARDAVQRGRDLTLADALRLESDLNLLLATTDDRAEGIAAFFEKRPPRFTGE